MSKLKSKGIFRISAIFAELYPFKWWNFNLLQTVVWELRVPTPFRSPKMVLVQGPFVHLRVTKNKQVRLRMIFTDIYP